MLPDRPLELLDGGFKLVDIFLRHESQLNLLKILLGDLEVIQQVLHLLALLLQTLVG